MPCGSRAIVAGKGTGIVIALALMFGGAPAAANAGQASCPPLTSEVFTAQLTASRALPARHFRFGGAHFFRASGKVSCEMAGGRGATYPVCRFSNPVALQVTTGRGRYDFFPGSGSATVMVRGGEVSCLKGG